MEGGSLPPVALSPAQAVALLAAVEAAPDAPYSDLAAAAVRKIMDVLDPHTRQQVSVLAQRVWVDSPPSASRSARSACEQAMTNQRVLRIHFISAAGEHTRRDVEPILFAGTGGGWYLIGWCRLRGAVRWFALDRIRKATLTRHPCSGHTVDEIGTPPDTAASVSLD